MIKPAIFILICVFVLSQNTYAYNLRKIIEVKGSVVYSIYQDEEGLMHIGTNAGMSTYDGKSAVIQSGFAGVSSINGTQTNNLFIESLHGFKVIDKNTGLTTGFDMFNNVDFSTSDSKGTIFLIQGNGSVYYKTNSQAEFDNIIISDLISANIKAFFIHNDALQIVMDNGVLRCFEIGYVNETVYLNEKPIVIIPHVLFCFENENHIYIIDNDYSLYDFDLTQNDYSFIADLKPILSDKGQITSGVVFRNEFYIGTESGMIVIQENEVSKTLIKKGINCLLKDRFQDLIWIGTSAGIYTYSYDPHTIKSNLFTDFTPVIDKPITAITTNSNELWLGTEGAGLIVIEDYDIDNEITDIQKITTNDGLPDNTIQALHTTFEGIWIGCKTGLADYSFKNKSFNVINNVLFRDIKAVYQHESELWLASYTKGIVKADIVSDAGKVKVISTKLYSVNSGDEASNRFTAIHADKGQLLFTNEGNGIYEIAENDLTRIASENDNLNYINNICAINDTEYLVTTDFGIGTFTSDNQKANNFVFLNNTTSKDIVSNRWNDYWISSNNGLMLYNNQLKIVRYFDKSYGVEIDEYSTGASYYDNNNETIYFGGINGFTAIKYNFYDESMDYMPTLFLSNFSLYGIDHNINEFISSDKLVLDSNENSFSVTFNALDYINGNNYIYYYKIGENGKWIDNGNSGTVAFTDVSPGNLHLYVKYYNKMLYKESYAIELPITVLPPWYLTTYAYFVYFIVFVLILFLTYREYTRRRLKRIEEEHIKAEQQRKEEIHEAKLDFFTDMAHELCTPLTLISGPCNLILEQKNTNPSVIKYADLINRNAKRMNSLINSLMDFKQMESGHKQPEITRLNVSDLADRIIDTFQINASGEKINIKKQYYAGINWNSDEGFLTTILVNLISNAVKYSTGENIQVNISVENKILVIKVTNKGKGISEDNIDKIFNKYAVLDNPDLKHWKQNGLGLAITGSKVKLLSGKINVESVLDDTTSFIVELPFLETSQNHSTTISPVYDATITTGFQSPKAKYEFKEGRRTVSVIDDNPEMLWYICDMLQSEFNVLPINKPAEAIEAIYANHTDIILCDLMMDELDGIGFTQMLKSDKGTSHIPLIIVSAAHDIDIQTEAINAGAELFITKPFDNAYLKSAIRRLLGRKEDLKDYFASPLSAYELSMGKLQHAEHRKLLKKIHNIINKNIENKDLSPDFIATELDMSTRSLYRKLKEATDKGLLEIIQEGKLSVAENLLLKSKLTIDEVVFKSGFSSRSSFYRAFQKKYGCSPKEFIERNTVL